MEHPGASLRGGPQEATSPMQRAIGVLREPRNDYEQRFVYDALADALEALDDGGALSRPTGQLRDELDLAHSRLAAVEAVAKLCEERAGTRWGVDPYSDAAARIRRALGDGE